MKNITKNGISKVKNILINIAIAGIIFMSGVEIFVPKISEADFLFDNCAYLADPTIVQDNTLLSKSNPVQSPQIIKKIKMIVTAYSSTPEQTDSTPFITASGSIVKDGIVANNLLPFGAKVRLPGIYGDKVFVVEDRMNQKKGKYHLDIWFDNELEAKEFGSELAYVEILAN